MKFRQGSLETQEGNRIAQGIVDQEKHEDNEVVQNDEGKCRWSSDTSNTCEGSSHDEGHRINQARRNRATKQRKVRRGQEARHQTRRQRTDDKKSKDSLPKERADKITVGSFSSVKRRS